MTPTPTPWYAAFTTSDPVIQWLINLIRAVAILAIALFVARYGKLWCVRLLARSRVSLNLATLLGNLTQAAIVTVGVVSLLPSFGIDWTGLLTLVGAAGLAISLSMQDLLKNIIAGIYILIEQPFRIGDRITVKDATGIVEGVELRTTILRTEDNLNVVVPNNTIMNEVLTNRSVSDLQRQLLSVTLRETRLSTISQ